MIETSNLAVGYGKEILISDINIEVKPGQIVTLIGPNGSGKSTILKSITRQLSTLAGSIAICGRDMASMKESQVAEFMSMVMTERIEPELMTCREVVATGRYPYTGRLGILSKEDWEKVDEAIGMVSAEAIANQAFARISDGQRQRIMLARAICQDTEIIVLDEPTSFLDMKYKLELLRHVRTLAKTKNKAIIMSLHELDLVKMISDRVVCVDGSKVVKVGSVDEIFSGHFIQDLYGVAEKEFDPKTATLHMIDETDAKGQSFKMTAGQETFSRENVQRKSQEETQEKPTRHHAKVIMVQGTMSNAGKSLLVAALCRIFKQDGYRVAPFKSQNMALNSFITEEGLEMGRAQVMQAEAAGIKPRVCMNPILLKPTNDQGSQVIVNGQVLGNMPARDYFKYKKQLIPDIKYAFAQLEQMADIIVIEGAGSPAEINLRENDIVNMGLAEMLDAPVLLVGDIDRGGVFAQLLGTIDLLTPSERNRVKGLIINKFRGDKTILDPGIDMLEEKGKIPVTGVLPYIQITLDDEDSLSSRFDKREKALINLAIVRLPRISNFTDFSVFEQFEEVALHYVINPRDLEHMDMVLVPGSKNTLGDMKWLRESGMETAIKRFAMTKPVFGICGGYQMLGSWIKDPEGVEEGGSIKGLELLDLVTTLKAEKIRTQYSEQLGQLEGPLACLSGKTVSGYEIHMGDTLLNPGVKPMAKGAYAGNVYGSYIHGFFDHGDLAFTLIEALAAAKGATLSGESSDYEAFKESQYDLLAATMRKHLDMDAIYGMLKEVSFEEEELQERDCGIS